MDHRGRFQAQGDNVEKSESWIQQNSLNKSDARALLDTLQLKLTRREYEVRDIALERARNFVNLAPATGYEGVVIKTYNNPGQRKAVRIDLEIRAGYAFCNDLQP